MSLLDDFVKNITDTKKINKPEILSETELTELDKLKATSDGTYETDNKILKSVMKILDISYVRRYTNWNGSYVNIKYYAAGQTEKIRLAVDIVLPHAKVIKCKELRYPSFGGTSVLLPYKRTYSHEEDKTIIQPSAKVF